MIIKRVVKKLLGLTYPYPAIQRDILNFSKKYSFNANLNIPIDICILTLNRHVDTKRTLASLFKTTLPFHLIIIDQKSDDGTREMVQEFAKNHDNVTLILLEENLGVSGGRAKAVEFAKHDYLAFIDNDMVFAPGYFEHMIEKMQQDSELAGIFAKVVLPNSKIEVNTPTLSEENNWLIFNDEDRGKNFKDKSTLNFKDCEWIPMGVSLWKKSVLKEIKIDADLIGAYEDNDYTYRVHKTGYKLSNCPKSLVLHIKAEFTKSIADKNYTEGRFNPDKLRFAVKHFYQKHNKYLAFGDINGHVKYLGFNSTEEYINFLKS